MPALPRHAIDTTLWHWWKGPPPEFEQTAATPFVRPGLDGTGQMRLGRHGTTFQRTLLAFYNSYDLALEATRIVNAMSTLDYPVQVIFNNINYKQRFQHSYYVNHVYVEAVERWIFIGGIGYGPGVLIATFDLLPFYEPKPKPKRANT